MKPKVLFLDDEPDLLDGIRRGLRNDPFEVLTTTSAEEGLRILAEKDIAIVVSDESMPGMRGSDFLALVAERHPMVLTMLLTGHGDLETAMRAINHGRVSRFLLKPCPLPELRQILGDAIQLRSLAVASSRLLMISRREHAVLEELELRHPGITHVTKTDDGAVVIDEGDAPMSLEPNPAPRSVEDLISQIEVVLKELQQRKVA